MCREDLGRIRDNFRGCAARSARLRPPLVQRELGGASCPSRVSLIVRCSCVSLALAACSAGAEAPKDAPVANVVDMVITERGFEPQNLRVKKNEPVKLTITRKTASTCATEIVIDEYKVNVKLPLNEPVTVSFTPTKDGQLKYGCAMDKMIGGVIKVL